MLSSTNFSIEVQELRRPDRVHSLSVRWYTSISDIKNMIYALTNYPVSRMRIFHSSNSSVLRNQTTLRQLGIDKDGQILTLSFDFNCTTENMIEPVKDYPVDTICKELLSQVRMGLNNANVPSKTDLLDCTGGVYFMKSSSNAFVGVFKPHDEEQGMPNNPKGYAGNGKHGLRANFKPGEGYLREAAAYLLDHQNFCQVPGTVIAHCVHPVFNYPKNEQKDSQSFPKLGSLQQYVRASDTFEDISSSLIGTFELQKIALLDLRLLNCDRNASNILAVRKLVPNTFRNPLTGQMSSRNVRRDSRSGSLSSLTEDMDDEEIEMSDFLSESRSSSNKKTQDLYELIPIDHGYCLPSKLLIEEFDWTWFYCSQIEEDVDPEIKRYMYSIDIEESISLLTAQMKEAISSDALFLLRIMHYLILESFKFNFTLKQMAELVARVEDGVASPLEKLLQDCEENAHRTLEARHSAALTPYSTAKLSFHTNTSSKGDESISRKATVKFSETIQKENLPNNNEKFLSPVRATQSMLEISNVYRPTGALVHMHTIDSSGIILSGSSKKSNPSLTPPPPVATALFTASTVKKSVKKEGGGEGYLTEEPLTSDETSSVDFSTSPRSQLGDFQNFVFGHNNASGSLLGSNTQSSGEDDYENSVSLEDDLDNEQGQMSTVQAALLSLQMNDNNENEDTTCEDVTPPSSLGTIAMDSSSNSNSNSNNNSFAAFSTLEVQTTEPINFDKCSSKQPLKKRFSNKAPPSINCNSGCTSEEEDFRGLSASKLTANNSMSGLRKSRLLGGGDSSSSPEGFASSQDDDDRQSVTSQSSDILLDIPAGPSFATMSRVVSFGAFESPALYSLDDDDDEPAVLTRPTTSKAVNGTGSSNFEKLKKRQFHQLKKEKRLLQKKTPEFEELRYEFAQHAVKKLLQNVRNHSGHY
jgi:hypothetical protein